jgi:DNA polymerase-3 subunit gamma/tau
MGQALYRKYRSKSLDEIVGQDHITQSLKQAIKSGRISHAYLLTGPRGVGKTSVARILAHEINNLPYTDDSTHIDIIEIDAASNRRIDEIRELREKVYIAPTSVKYKVYIIDEVHMLTKEAFNALLKTLEEPPAHVVFILATTDAHKLPETIISRTQRYTFKPVNNRDVIKHLKFIAKTERIKIDDEALELLAEHGEGSFRDAISLFDQASNYNTVVTATEVRQLLGIPPKASVLKLVANVFNKNSLSVVINDLNNLFNHGYQAAMIAKQMAQIIRDDMLTASHKFNESTSLFLLGKLIETPAAHDPERYLELTLLSFASISSKPIGDQPMAVEDLQPIDEIEIAIDELPVEKVVSFKKAPVEQSKFESPQKSKPEILTDFESSIWPELLSRLKKSHNTLYGVIRMAQPSLKSNTLELSFEFAFHQKRIRDSKNAQIIADVYHELTDQKILIECVVDKNAKPQKYVIKPEPANKTTESQEIKTISNIFGSAELLES